MTREQLMHLDSILARIEASLKDADDSIDVAALGDAQEEIRTACLDLMVARQAIRQELRLAVSVDLLLAQADREWHAEPIALAAGRVA